MERNLSVEKEFRYCVDKLAAFGSMDFGKWDVWHTERGYIVTCRSQELATCDTIMEAVQFIAGQATMEAMEAFNIDDDKVPYSCYDQSLDEIFGY